MGLPLALVLILPTPPVKKIQRPVFEDFSKVEDLSKVPKVPVVTKNDIKKTHIVAKKVSKRRHLPKIAIIIDDMGYEYIIDEKFIRMAAPLSFAFLPYGPNTKRLARLAASKKRDILVHVPMEPDNKNVDPGPGVLTLDMDIDALIETLEQNIKAVPGAIGVNNHMGSRFTANRKAMKYVLTILKQKGLFFVDSRTTKKTVAFEMAQKMGVPSAERAVFLDNSESKRAIEFQLRRLVRLAKRDGMAIGIGHPYRITYEVLYRMLPAIQKEVVIVPVHRLVH